jgi:uncharacterized protein (TIGR02300 family)
MPAKDLGNKFICFKCSTRFYDLKKPQPLCPKCGADQRDVPVVKASRRTKEKEPVVVAPEVEEAGEDEEDAEADAEEEEPEDDL